MLRFDLQEKFGGTEYTRSAIDLAEFQEDAVKKVRNIPLLSVSTIIPIPIKETNHDLALSIRRPLSPNTSDTTQTNFTLVSSSTL